MKPKTATKIISLVQVKGGAGRSTIATNLAGELTPDESTAIIGVIAAQCRIIERDGGAAAGS